MKIWKEINGSIRSEELLAASGNRWGWQGHGVDSNSIRSHHITTRNTQTKTCHSISSSPLVPIRLHSRYQQLIEPCCHTAAARSASKRQCRRKLYLLDEMPANPRKHWSMLHWTERHVRRTECHVSRCDKCVTRDARWKQGVSSYSGRFF